MNVGPNIPAEVWAYFNDRASALFLVLSKDGVIVEANQYARSVTARPLIGDHIRDVIIDFTDKFDLADAANDPSQERLISLGTASGLPQSFFLPMDRRANRTRGQTHGRRHP